jgi:hypothetical protein
VFHGDLNLHVTYGDVHYHLDDPNLQRALAVKEYHASINAPSPPIIREKKLKKKLFKKKTKKSKTKSSPPANTPPRARTRETDAEDALVRRSRARAHDFFGDYEEKEQ